MWERWRREITGKRPHRCRECRSRIWAVDTGLHFPPETVEAATRAIAPDPPDLDDTLLTREPRPRRDLDLHALDGHTSNAD